MDIPSLATQCVAYFQRENALRSPSGEVGRYLTVFEVAEALDFDLKGWPFIKEEILRRGIPICFTPGKGHFLGYEGEEAFNVLFTARMAQGWSNRARRYMEALPPDGTHRADYAAKKGLNWNILVDGLYERD